MFQTESLPYVCLFLATTSVKKDTIILKNIFHLEYFIIKKILVRKVFN
jgi:hypothetical protein